MFTGLIQDVGTVKQLAQRGNYKVLTVASALAADDLRIGESIACDGACLTVVSFNNKSFTVEASQETVARTTIGNCAVGTRLNLERAMQLNDRLGGHLVSGHIDATGEVKALLPIGESWQLRITYDPEFDKLVVTKGSISVNGVSLTVNDSQSGLFGVNIIPHTYAGTTLGMLKTGSRVNLEFDLIGKYILKISGNNLTTGLTIDKLRKSGW